MTNIFQKRKEEDPDQPRAGLARRATDNALRGMQVKEDNSDGGWSDWEAAVLQAQVAPQPDGLPVDGAASDGPTGVGRESADTKPLPLEPDS